MTKDSDKEANESLVYDHVRVSPTEQIDLHLQRTWELSYIIMGRGTRVLGDTTEAFAAGEVVLVLPNMPHKWSFDPASANRRGMIENVTVCFSPDLLKRLAKALPEFRDMVDWYNDLNTAIKLPVTLAKDIAGRLLAMEHESVEHRLGTFIGILADIWHNNKLTMAVGHFPKNRKAALIIDEVKTWLRCNYQREVHIEAVARYVGMNSSYLCTCFKRLTGDTIFHYLIRLRIDMACQLLETTDMTVSECCYQCGYNDLPYFSRTFKAITGLTPSQYRQKRKR